MGNQKYTIQRRWEHKTQDEDKQNKKHNTEYQKDEQQIPPQNMH
jgi:hypothetical protein